MQCGCSLSRSDRDPFWSSVDRPKLFVLSDSVTGYISKFTIYTGKDTIEEEAEFGLCSQVIVDLLEGLEHRGHLLFTDNYYTSPELYTYLYEREVYACGTLRCNRKGVPPLLKKMNLPKVADVDRGYYVHFSKKPLLCCV